jgi:Trk K+ transport system NAD-binding subunit
VLPRGVTTFEAGDEVLAITDPVEEERLAALFTNPEE